MAMTEDELYNFLDDEKFPFKQLSVGDFENLEIKKSMKLSCVAFIDILGFSEMVKKDIDKVVLALRYVKLFRDSYCRLPSVDYIGKGNIEDVLPESTMFSDSIVLSHVIDEDFDFYAFVLYIAELQMALLKEGITIRGGVEIGELYHDTSFVFGDGLIAAYKLESKYAIYPRILVGEKLLAKIEEQFEERFERELLNNGAPKNWRDYENNDLKYISTDKDGLKFINYLRYGLVLVDAHDTRPKDWDMQNEISEEFYEDTLCNIREFIKSELVNDDLGVREKYIWLKNLYNRTLDIFVNRAHGGQAEEYKKRWSCRFIGEQDSGTQILLKDFPDIFVGDMVLIKSCSNSELKSYMVDRILIDGQSFQSDRTFHSFSDVIAIYRFDEPNLKCIWRCEDYKENESVA